MAISAVLHHSSRGESEFPCSLSYQQVAVWGSQSELLSIPQRQVTPPGLRARMQSPQLSHTSTFVFSHFGQVVS